jgi:hypothetical protein
MPARQLYLLLDQIEIIQQPFRCRGDWPARIDRKRPAIKVTQDFFVPIQTRQQPISRAAWPRPVQARDYPGVTLKLLDSEQLRPERRLALLRRPERLPFQRCPKTRSESRHTFMNHESFALTSRNFSIGRSADRPRCNPGALDSNENEPTVTR